MVADCPKPGSWRDVNDVGVIYAMPDRDGPADWREAANANWTLGPRGYETITLWLEQWALLIEARQVAAQHRTVAQCESHLDLLSQYRPTLDREVATSHALYDCRTMWRAVMDRRAVLLRDAKPR